MIAPAVDKIHPLLALVDQIQADGVVLDLQSAADGSLCVGFKARAFAVGHGGSDSILVDELHVSLEGLSLADLQLPRSEMLAKAKVRVHHFAVRIARALISDGLAHKLEEKGLENVALLFAETDAHKIMVRAKLKGISFEVGLTIGARNNRLLVDIGTVRLAGFLPVPAFIRKFVLSLGEGYVGRPGIEMDGTTVLIDPLRMAPIPLQVRLTHFQTRGRYLLLEGGDV